MPGKASQDSSFTSLHITIHASLTLLLVLILSRAAEQCVNMKRGRGFIFLTVPYNPAGFRPAALCAVRQASGSTLVHHWLPAMDTALA